MKKAATFFGGLIVGVLGTLLVLYLIVAPNKQLSEDGLYGLTIFLDKGECIPTESTIEVFQVLKPNMALAHTHKNYDDRLVVLLINYEGKSYYNKQKVKIPTGECARQIGTYQYSDNMFVDRTVPAVVIE